MISGISRSPLAIEGELHLAVAGLLHPRDLLIVGAVVGAARDRATERARKITSSTVTGVPSENLACRIERELDEAPIVRRLDLLGDQAIERERLVVAAGEQALMKHIRGCPSALCAFDDERIETVEGGRAWRA